MNHYLTRVRNHTFVCDRFRQTGTVPVIRNLSLPKRVLGLTLMGVLTACGVDNPQSSSSSAVASSSSSAPPCPQDTVTMHARVNDGAWQTTTNLNITQGDTIELGPHPNQGGQWQWSGCGASGSEREQQLQPANVCQVNAVYTNACGAQTTASVNVSVTEPTEPAQPEVGECGAGQAQVVIAGGPGNYTINGQGAGGNFLNAIRDGLSRLSSGRNQQERMVILADGDIGGNRIDIPSNTIFEMCGTMDTARSAGNGAIQAIGVRNVSIPYLSMTGTPWFGMRFADIENLHLGQIDLRLSAGMGIRFERDLPGSRNVTMDHIYVSGTDNHGVETWNVDGLKIGTVIARNTQNAGLLLNNTRNAEIDLVDGENTGTGTGYATLRFANRAGRVGNNYPTNIFVNRVISRGGGRGLFCVSESGGVEINSIDFANNGNNAILLENCYNVTIHSGNIQGGGEVRIAARPDEFANSRDITIANLTVRGTSVRESPCADNSQWVNLDAQGGSVNICD